MEKMDMAESRFFWRTAQLAALARELRHCADMFLQEQAMKQGKPRSQGQCQA